MRQGMVFDSKISKRVTQEDLRVSYKVSEDELDFITKLYQAYKIRKLTIAPTIELFMKELVFSNIEIFKERSDYAHIYPEVPKV
jgi:hypothetical protein